VTARIQFVVSGIPVSQGSLRAFVRNGKAVQTHGNRTNLDGWRIAVAQEARTACTDMLTGPVAVYLTFLLPRPAGHTGKRGLLPSAPAFPHRKPDIDRLARACLDALTGVVYLDDAQVTDLVARKRYADGQPGVVVEVVERVA